LNCVHTGAKLVPERVSAQAQESPLKLALVRAQEQSYNRPDCRQRAYTKPEQVPTNVLPERALQSAMLVQEQPNEPPVPELTLLTEGLPGVPETFSAQGHDAVPEPYNAEAVGHILVWERA
jgi:hypothetical protein